MAEDFGVRFLVSRDRRKIIYMEAGKQVIDILLGFLQLPIVSVAGSLALTRATNSSQGGTFTNLFRSLQLMDQSMLMMPKSELLHPTCPPILTKLSGFTDEFKLRHPLPDKLYRCSKCNIRNGLFGTTCDPATRVSAISGEPCRVCDNGTMSVAVPLDAVVQDKDTPGFVQPHLAFIVFDNLDVMPASKIDNILVLRRHGVNNLHDVYSVEARVSAQHVLDLLAASFSSCGVLTEVFRNLISTPTQKQEVETTFLLFVGFLSIMICWAGRPHALIIRLKLSAFLI
ncbi:hypothetical protein KP509_19G028600 [Ceratopteris richardii]|uniref:Uncharacterized protein n=1 Tax=Ceratopteris richardii TaxID=49495 RepID=A0A8T2SM24_CERRI|nr:hypothetical protein KP509_19G028600 [Ceratopteris richardii]